MTQNSKSSGLRIWEQVQATDPAYTRRFTRASGFEGTAINPTYLVRKATEVFGPFGIGWGVELIEERYVEGHAIGFPADGSPATRSVIHVGRYEVWYEIDGKRGSAKHYGQTTFVGRSIHGEIYTNEEAPKMSQTDAMCKALSMLGFGADVHLGLFDDSKYVADLEAAFSAGLRPNGTTPAADPTATGGDPAGRTPEGELSPRYKQFKERLRKGSIEDKKTARSVIEQDPLLTDFERRMLLSTSELKLHDDKSTHDGKRAANAVAEPFL